MLLNLVQVWLDFNGEVSASAYMGHRTAETAMGLRGKVFILMKASLLYL